MIEMTYGVPGYQRVTASHTDTPDQPQLSMAEIFAAGETVNLGRVASGKILPEEQTFGAAPEDELERLKRLKASLEAEKASLEKELASLRAADKPEDKPATAKREEDRPEFSDKELEGLAILLRTKGNLPRHRSKIESAQAARERQTVFEKLHANKTGKSKTVTK